MDWRWSDLFALISIIAGLIGFTFAGPGNVQSVGQALFYIFAVFFLMSLFRRLGRKKPDEPSRA